TPRWRSSPARSRAMDLKLPAYVSAHVELQRCAHVELQRCAHVELQRRSCMLDGSIEDRSKQDVVQRRDPRTNGSDDGAAVAVESDAQGESSANEPTRLSEGRRLMRAAEVVEGRVLRGQGDERRAQAGVKHGEDGEFRGLAQVGHEGTWPRRHGL